MKMRFSTLISLFPIAFFPDMLASKDLNPLPVEFREAMKDGAEFPLKIGHRWTYQIDGRDILFLETLPGELFNNRKTVRLRAQGDSVFWEENLFLAVEDGNLMHFASMYQNSMFIEQPPHILLKKPIREGSSWISFSRN